VTVGPLVGKRVVITRAAKQSDELIDRLRALGAEPVSIALIEIDEPSDGGASLHSAIGRLASFSWLIVASPNGARRIAPALAALDGDHRPRIAAVGRSTASALGCHADLVPARQLAAGLVEEFPEGTGDVVVVQPEADMADSALVLGIRAKGWTVEAVDGYRTKMITPTSSQRLAAAEADAVLFASGSSARSWFAAFGSTTPAISIAIGPATAQEMIRIGLKITAVATDYSLQGLIDALIAQIDSAK
jgi:uroporphyrinogen-III synthase